MCKDCENHNVSPTPGVRDFRIVDKLQVYGEDITKIQLRYHDRRILVSKEFTFDAAHHLHEYEGKCKNLHGHTYRVVFGISWYTNEIGLAVDFGDIKTVWKNYVEPYLDHKYLNESLPHMNTTAENMVYWIFNKMQSGLVQHIPSDIVNKEVFKNEWPRVEFVRLYETPTSYAEFRREWL